MRFVFRADASEILGTGHVMRCLALAEEAISRGHDCVFVGRINEKLWIKRKLKELGIQKIVDEPNLFAPNTKTDILVLDSYTEPFDSLYNQPEKWKLLVAISDEDTPEYNSSIEIRQSVIEIEYSTQKREIYSGPDFLLLRREIKKPTHKIQSDKPLSIVIVGGGTDIYDFSYVMGSLVDEVCIAQEIHLFSKNNAFLSKRNNVKIHPLGMHLHQISPDLALVTASCTSLEFLAREVPIGIVCAVENQKKLYQELGERKLAIQLGDYQKNIGWRINYLKTAEFLTSAVLRKELMNNIKDLIDLKGASRVVEILEARATE